MVILKFNIPGLRPGEKLYEELLIGDNVDGTEHPRIMKAHEDYLPYDEFVSELEILQKHLSENDFEAVSNQLTKLVDGFNHNLNIVDYLN